MIKRCSRRHQMRPLLLSLVSLFSLPVVHAAPVVTSSVIQQRDVRDAHFANALYYQYQNLPYDALTTFLGNPRLELQATGSMNVLLSDLYARYGLVREADAALSRVRGSDVLTSHRNAPWLRYGKLLYQNQQNALALNLLRQPPQLLTPAQDSERTIMVANILLREGRTDDAVELLQTYQTSSPFFRVMARYNLALALLRTESRPQQALTDAQVKQRRALAVDILDKLLNNQEPVIPTIVQPRQTETTDKSGILGLFARDNKPADLNTPTRLSYLNVSSGGKDLEIEDVTEVERLNLRDKIALSLAFLHLTDQKSGLARETLRNVRLDSPYSNQALLTSAHVFYQLGDFQRSYNFATELSRRHAADPLVQEGWLLAARALEEQKDPAARERYQEASRLYKAQTARINDLLASLEQQPVLSWFPTGDIDPVLLPVPALPQGEQAGLWAQLLDQTDILSILQQRRQTQLLNQRLSQYQQRLVSLESNRSMDADDKLRLVEARRQYERVKQQFEQAEQQDDIALKARIRAQLTVRQNYLARYLTESLLGLQRLDQSANKDR
jgi:hypothetical protein